MKNNSIWLEDLNLSNQNKLTKNLEIDILIIGGGITGLSAAYHLKDSNKKICLVERNQVGHGVTSKTTGKLTFLQETTYTTLKNLISEENSKKYLKSQQDAIKLVENIITKNNIDCNYQKVPSYVFTNNQKDIPKIKKEKELLEKFGVKVTEHQELPDKQKILYGIKVNNTAVFHPLKYLSALKEICQKNNISIYENTKINKIEKEKDYFICKTNENQIKTKKIIIATHYPYFLKSFFMPLKAHLQKSYICAYKTDKNHNFTAITSAKPTTSLRYYENKKECYKIYLTGSHNLAVKNNEKENFKKLQKNLPTKPNYIWSNKDIITNDYLPFIGELKPNLFIGTGYNTWGMTNGSLAGKILNDLAQNKENEYQELFSPKRSINLSKIINFPLNLVSNLKSFIENKIIKNKSWYKEKVKFKKINGQNVGIYIDKNHKKHIVYNLCPHLKCSLIFNEQEKTWDCPCHGSRFDIDGNCIEGPSNYNITYKK